jgi:hypothetical protein
MLEREQLHPRVDRPVRGERLVAGLRVRLVRAQQAGLLRSVPGGGQAPLHAFPEAPHSPFQSTRVLAAAVNATCANINLTQPNQSSLNLTQPHRSSPIGPARIPFEHASPGKITRQVFPYNPVTTARHCQPAVHCLTGTSADPQARRWAALQPCTGRESARRRGTLRDPPHVRRGMESRAAAALKG